jgi:hypothetical protein
VIWRNVAVSLAIAFALLNVVNALNKGGDAAVFFEGGRRLLNAQPLYEGSSAAHGFIGTPFQAVFFAPFAWVATLSPTAAKLVWHFVCVACLVAGIWLSASAWWPLRERIGLRSARWFPLLFAPLFAVLLPLQTNFEHQNMNPVLLALVAGATWHLTWGSAIAGGVLIGSATALKAFPALLLVYLAVRRRWSALLAAIASAVLLTILPVVSYGTTAYRDLLAAFWRLGNSGWPVRGNNQSLVAALDRFTSGLHANGVRTAAEAPLVATVFVGMTVVLCALLLLVLLRIRPTATSVPCEIAAVTVLMILLSPIAWDHYWTLLFPAFLILYDSGDTSLLGRAGRHAFWIAAGLTTALSPVTLGAHGFNIARALSVNTVAALIVYGAMLVLCGTSRGRKLPG